MTKETECKAPIKLRLTIDDYGIEQGYDESEWNDILEHPDELAKCFKAWMCVIDKQKEVTNND